MRTLNKMILCNINIINSSHHLSVGFLFFSLVLVGLAVLFVSKSL